MKLQDTKIANDIKKALQSAGLWSKFDGMANSHRKKYIQWIESAKRPDPRTTRITKMCQMLSANKKDTY